MGIETILIILLLIMILTAIIAVETNNILSAIISLGGIGFALTVAFLFLKAPDIAITQLVVEVLCIIFLIKATISNDIKTFDESRNNYATAFGFIILFILFLISYKIFSSFTFGNSIAITNDNASYYYLKNAVKETGSSNIVTAILFDYRGYDTLGEATVLFTSIVGAIVILRKNLRGKK